MMDKPNVLVVGIGVVGINVVRSLISDYRISGGKLGVYPYDKYKEDFQTKDDVHYDLAIICVDTPQTDNSLCSLKEVKAALRENEADLYMIKSTVLPCTTAALSEAYDKHIVFSPEYYGDTQHCNNFEFNYTILGGAREDCEKVIQILQRVYDARHKFVITDSTTAELAKYMENAYLATKVSFCNQFFDIAEHLGVSYEELRELFILDPRVNPSHTFVYRDAPYWDSHCLNKDVKAIAESFDAQLLKDIITFNDNRRT